MLVGYVRVSTEEQNEARQLVSLEERKVDKIFIDKKSGKNADRDGLKSMLAYVREGDTVITESISRIARSTKDLLTIIDTLTKKGKPPMQIDERQFRSVCKRWRAGEITATQAMKEMNLKPNTFYRRVNQCGL